MSLDMTSISYQWVQSLYEWLSLATCNIRIIRVIATFTLSNLRSLAFAGMLQVRALELGQPADIPPEIDARLAGTIGRAHTYKVLILLALNI